MAKSPQKSRNRVLSVRPACGVIPQIRFQNLRIWRFPEMGVPPNPFLDGIFPYKPSSYWGTPMAMETAMITNYEP